MRQTGRVQWYNDTKGYGCIRPDAGDDVLVRSSSIQGSGLKRLEAGETVAFEVTRGPAGPEAERVVPIDRSGAAE